jgi:hypothetical protein
MSRIPTPATIEAAPTASRPLLEGVKKQLGVVPGTADEQMTPSERDVRVQSD